MRTRRVARPGCAVAVCLGLAWLLGAGAPAGAVERLPLPPGDQIRVNEAIDKGVIFLRRTQGPLGTWAEDPKRHGVGYAALPGLTLLECGVPASDPQVQRAAAFVRANCAKLDGTYELSLANLFLDRLGDPRDKPLIQMLALRLIAGQSTTGGWSYKCPLLNPVEQRQLLTVLQQLDPPKPEKPGQQVPGPGGQPGRQVPSAGSPGHQQSRSDSPGRQTQPSPGQDTPAVRPAGEPADALSIRRNLCIKADSPPPEPKRTVADRPADAPKPKPPAAVVIPPNLRLVPVLNDPDKLPLQDPEAKGHTPTFGTTDNSNTQFAMLALWAARKHDVPVQRSLNPIVRRYRTSQNPDGRWGYHYRHGGGEGGSPAMTCAGLIGLAMGHGIAEEPDAKERAARDELMQKGFLALYKLIGTPTGRMQDVPMQNLYFLWSVERVAVLYNLPTIADKDWYRWGAEILVANQGPYGQWEGGGYPGATPTTDTCLALLFLKRVNLTRDLTARLTTDPNAINKQLQDQLPQKPLTPAPKEPVEPEEPDPPAPPQVGSVDPGTVDAPKPKDQAPQGPFHAPKPPDTTPAAAATSETDAGGWVLWGLLIVGLLFAAGLIIALIVYFRQKQDSEDDDEDDEDDAYHRRGRTRVRTEARRSRNGHATRARARRRQ